MAETTTINEAETHVVEIPMDSGASDTDTTTTTSHPQQCLIAHPLSEISASPGHLLLLKLYQREEDQLAHRTGQREAHLDAIKRDAFRLSSLFFSFHALFLTLLFAASSVGPPADGSDDVSRACRNWWVPSCLSLFTSAVLVLSVQLRMCEYWRAFGRLRGDRDEARAVARRMRELRMKGASFDLSRELPQGGAAAGKRMKSSSVEVRWWRPARWVSRNLVTVCLFLLAGLLVPACKFVLCS